MRLLAAVVLVCVPVVCAACGSPPDKEINQARGAVEAATAAGAATYAPEEYAAARAALKRAEDAVAQRDYRQALNAALDASDRARNAARQAGDQKAQARSEAERSLYDAQAVLDAATDKARAAERARPKRRGPLPERAVITAAEASLQKAREAIGRQDYAGAREATTGVADRLRAAIQRIEQAAAPAAPKRRR